MATSSLKSTTTTYNAESIETLRFPENIRRNPGMYLGSTDEHGRWLIARELLDNGLDEALANRNKGNVFVEDKDGSYWVLDYGNGIPQGTKTITLNLNGKNVQSKIPTMQAIFSEMHTSGKFRSDAYKVSVGCFTGDTKIRLKDKAFVSFKTLYDRWQVNENPITIESWDVNEDKPVPTAKITNVLLTKYTKHLVCVTLSDGIEIKCTPDHPFYVRFAETSTIEKVQAVELNPGDVLVTAPSQIYSSYTVESVQELTLKEEVPVYGMTVESCHTYFVEPGVLVRNSHGCGSKGTNATSEFFHVSTFYENNWYEMGFERGILTKPVAKLSSAPKGPFNKTLTKGTCIHFKPDAKIFGKKSTIDINLVKQWAEITSYLTPGFTVLVIDKKGNKTKYFSKEGPKEYVSKILTELKAEAEPQQFEFHNELCDVVVAFSTAEACNVRGYTNGLFNSEGGKHVDSVVSCLYDAVKKHIKAKQNFSVHNFKEGLVGLVNIKLHKAEFSSQDKSRLTDLRAGEDFKAMLSKEVNKFFSSNKSLAQRLCEKASKLSQLMDKFKASKKVVSALNAVKRKGLPAKYAPFDSKTKVEDRELLLVEGDSASGGLREERLPYQSLLPLRGKILNVGRPGKQDKSLESAEIISILGALGYDPKAPDPLSKLQVSKVICLADADPDGPVSEDTLIWTTRGVMTIKEVAEKYEQGIHYFTDRNPLRVYGYDERRREIVSSDLNWAGITCKKTVEYELTFNTGFTVECTDSHKWAFWNEEEVTAYYKRTDDLEVGDSVIGYNKEVGFTTHTIIEITSRILPKEKPFYCLDVEGVHNFFVVDKSNSEQKYLCHNCHINTLLLTLFHTYLPEMFDRGMVYVADMPEFYALYKDQFFSGNTVSEVRSKMNKARVPSSVEVNHIKGWGEIDASLMRILAVDPNTRKLIKIKPVTEDDKVTFTKLMAEDVEFRRKLLGLADNV